jgi:hypothetical protein
MSNASRRNDKSSTSSGHGALGMGGQPDDDPRDLDSGRETPAQDDLGSRTDPVDGASGSPSGPRGDHALNEAVGVTGDKAFDDVQKVRERK